MRNRKMTPENRCARVQKFASVALCLLAAPLAMAQAVQEAAPATEATTADDGTVVLSPFVVTSDDDKGYLATNTMSGTRINSKLEDLAASISVVTKQQLLDTAATDINDIFAYEGNTEGTHTFTAFEIDAKGNPIDTTGVDPQNANRIRGMGAANVALGGYATQSSVPIDTYNVDSVEISRGPNSNIFGLGESSGTVNLNRSNANPTKDSTSLNFTVDSNGGTRASIDINRALIKNKLALRFIGLNEDKGFERKPSKDRTNRYTFAATLRPWKYTTIRASVEQYDNVNSRPNSVTPRDYITPWIEAGMPTWNPLTRTAYIDGVAQKFIQRPQTTSGYYDADDMQTQLIAADATVPEGWVALAAPGYNQLYSTLGAWGTGLGVLGGTTTYTRLNTFVDQGQIGLYTSARGTKNLSGTTIPGPTVSQNDFLLVSSGRAFSPVQDKLWRVPGISNQALYDWENVNFAAPNIATKKAQINNVEFEQFFLATERHQLALQLGILDEHSHERRRNYVGQVDGAPAAVAIDVNQFLLDGSVNPYYLRPYIAGGEPQIYEYPVWNRNMRGTLAYQLDLSREKGWLRFFGRQNIVGYMEQRDTHRSPRGLRYQERITTETPWNPRYDANGGPNRLADSGAHTKSTYRFYAGDANGFNIDYAPTRPDNYEGMRTLHWYNGQTRQWVDDEVNVESLYFAIGTEKTQIRTKGAVWQASMLRRPVKWLPDFELIPTLGKRWDNVATKVGGGYYNEVGEWIPTSSLTQYTWTTVDGQPAYVTKGRALVDKNGYEYPNQTYDVAPNWESNRNGVTTTKGVVLRLNKTLSLHYNTANSFKPEGLAYNILLDELKNPIGDTKEYGFSINLFKGKLYARLNKYETVDQYARNGSIGAVASRPPRIDFATAAGSWQDEVSTADRFNLEHSMFAWAIAADHLTESEINSSSERSALLDKYMSQVWASPEMSSISFGGKNGTEYAEAIRTIKGVLADTNTITSKGYEFELNYNPNRYFSTKLSITKTQAIDTDLAASVMKYADSRLEVWQNVMIPSNLETYVGSIGTEGEPDYVPGYWTPDANAGKPWWTTVLTGNMSAFQQYASIVASPMAWATANAGKPRAQNREWKVRATTRYDLAGMTNNSLLKKFSVGGSLRWEDKAAIGFGAAEPDNDGIIYRLDPNKPYYDKARTYCDFWLSYRTKILKDKVGLRLQLNVFNALENGGLRVIGVNPDGSARDFRIVDPRVFKLSATFDF